jgi:hypothetical protein
VIGSGSGSGSYGYLERGISNNLQRLWPLETPCGIEPGFGHISMAELTWGAWHMVFHIPCTLQQDLYLHLYFPSLEDSAGWLVGWLVGGVTLVNRNNTQTVYTEIQTVYRTDRNNTHRQKIQVYASHRIK